MRTLVFVIALACGIAADVGAADIFKCTDASGTVEYRDKACSPRAASAKVRIDLPPNPHADADIAAMHKASVEFDARMSAQAEARRQSKAEADAAAHAAAASQPLMIDERQPNGVIGGPEAQSNDPKITPPIMVPNTNLPAPPHPPGRE